jgi:glucosylceramidase
LIAACTAEQSSENPGTGGTGGATAASGTGGGNTGGSSGGSGPQAGAAGTTGGGAGGNQAGGSGPAGAGGSVAGTSGAGNPAGGAPPAGAGGQGTGGSQAGVGGDGTGGIPMGGSGGTEPVAGAAGSAGTPPVIDEPSLVTSANNAWWTVGEVTEVTSGTAYVTVNTGSEAQTFTGFGGTFNEKGWEALSALNEADRATAMKLLFDKADGANLFYGRIPIGASDYATNRYTLNDNSGDTAMAQFSLDRDRMRLIPYIKAALAVRPDIYFWGSPWTPPPWMKDNNAYDRGNMRDDDTILEAFALYLSKFVEEYAAEGIQVKAIHPQNEPGYAQDYPSCNWSGNLMAKFIGQFLGPMFEERQVPAEIFIGTMSNPTADRDVLNTVMGNATAKAFIRGHGLQWGMIDVYGNLSLDRSLPIWQTEHKCGNYPWEGGNANMAPNDFAYGVESWGLIKNWISRGVTAYSAWNMVLDTVGRSLDTVRPWAQNAPLVVDVSAKRLIITPTYYVFRHFSQYVDSGAKLVSTSGGDAMAFKNPDGSVVTVMYNSGGARQGAIVSVGDKLLQFDMPGNGWATVNWPAQ